MDHVLEDVPLRCLRIGGDVSEQHQNIATYPVIFTRFVELYVLIESRTGDVQQIRELREPESEFPELLLHGTIL